MNVKKPVKTKNPFAGSLYEVIHILSDINRMQILRLLADHGELCARDILTNFPITQPTLSHHMNVLLENKLVESRKSGRWVFYRLSESGIQKIIDIFENMKIEAGAAAVKGEEVTRKEKKIKDKENDKDKDKDKTKAKGKEKDKNRNEDPNTDRPDKKEKKKKKNKKK